MKSDVVAQTTMSGGMGLTFLNISHENSLSIANQYPNQLFLKDSEDYKYPTITGNLRIDRKLAQRFSCSYYFKAFVRNVDAHYTVSNPPPFNPTLGFKGKTQVISISNGGSMNFSFFENAELGIGGFYQTTQLSYFKLLFNENSGTLYHTKHQAGVLITAGFDLNKWSFRVIYQRSIGKGFYYALADSIDSIELAALYQFHTFKTKKERKLLRLQKGKQ